MTIASLFVRRQNWPSNSRSPPIPVASPSRKVRPPDATLVSKRPSAVVPPLSSDSRRSLATERRVSERRCGTSQTACGGDIRTRVTGYGDDATSVLSLRVEPPTLLVSVDRGLSRYVGFVGSRAFGSTCSPPSIRTSPSVLRAASGGRGRTLRGAALVDAEFGRLAVVGARAAFHCEIEEIIERPTYAIVIGRVTGSRRVGRL